MSDNKKSTVVIALGYFDSVHLGHKSVIERAKAEAEKTNSRAVVFTFKGNLKSFIKGEEEKTVFNTQEREGFIKTLGVDEVFFAPVNKEFLSKDKDEFLQYLNEKYEIKCYVSGEDYTFGKFGKGNINDIKTYAERNGQKQMVVTTFTINGEKVSTTAVKERLLNGDVKSVNNLLGRNYSVTGKVFEDRKVGHKIGFPTMNIKIDKDKYRIKDGVYSGKVYIDGKEFATVINYGARPTYDLNEKLIEAHAIGFNGNLYGKTVTLEFTDYIRDIKKFQTENDLKERLKKDVEFAKEGKYD